MAEAVQSIALSRLLQLASPMLPVGAYSYSQGLEWAIDCGDVHDLGTAQAWVSGVLEIYQAGFELPVLYRLYQAWQLDDINAVAVWDNFYQAGRDTSEALAETRQMGYSLVRLLKGLSDVSSSFGQQLESLESPSFAAVYAGTAYLWHIPAEAALHAYAWSWAENQVSAAMKSVPLGQVAGQTMLLRLGTRLPELVAEAMALPEEEISNFCPALTIAGCRHETQYTRLFRS